MARFLAVVEVPRGTEPQFRAALDRIRKWRFDKRGWVIKAYCTAEAGTIYVDAEAPSRERFAEWLAAAGWPEHRIESVDLVFEEGLIWPMRAHAAI